MFNNIGEKIKDIAVYIAIIGIFSSVIVGLVLLGNSSLLGIIVIVAGSLVSWLSTVMLYGFGQLVSNSDRIVFLLEDEYNARKQRQESENDNDLDLPEI